MHTPPTLALGSGPGGVQQARRWVVDACRGLGRADLAEAAELGVSELVTNALLHGAEPIELRLRGTREHPRVEVFDSSTEPPELPGESDLDAFDLDAFDPDSPVDDAALLTFGRGLAIVARAADAWGADIESTGKVVWFSPAAEISEDDGVEGVVTGLDPALPGARPDLVDRVEVAVLGIPLPLYIGFQQHFRELRREVRLLALAHEVDYPLAKSLSDLFGALERQLRGGLGITASDAALAGARSVADLHVRMPREAAGSVQRFIDLLDLADEFCRQERLLALARTPEQRAFQHWFLGEYVRQARGARPTPWFDTTPARRHAAH
ncbi:ATP-binding protein [Nocardioides insulae]|uniref:ATP-binding protein n=1 Tax=Nocardioides insulae TaxID=394734 RepID=UPI00042515B6|nr:ATP-binding protein [Nocardioides insulae]